MKRVVVTTGLHEADIRPPSLLSEFKRLSVEEARQYFGDSARLVDVSCPACDCASRLPVFEKETFQYNRCEECGSVYVSPRPTREALAEYYQYSKASRYRVEHFERETADARRSHVFSSNVGWVGQMLDQSGNPAARTYVDMGTSQTTIFDEMSALERFDAMYTWGPFSDIEEECRAKGIRVVTEPINDVGAVTAFEQIGHQFSPLSFLKSVSDMLAIDGILFFTTRTIDGFDLQTLWGNAPYIYPPEHLNLLSIEGLTNLVARAGLDLVELSTPGQLDVELVLHATRDDRDIGLPRFIRYLLEERGEEAHADFQAFLQKHRLSSHVRVAAARKKGSAA